MFPFWNDDIAKFKHDELFATDAHLLGRVTYETFAAAWPSRKDDTGFADRMNELPKFVVSTTLGNAECITRGHASRAIDDVGKGPAMLAGAEERGTRSDSRADATAGTVRT